jgi:septum site-determining protein MinD
MLARELLRSEGPMVRVVSVHSFRGGTGKSNLTANVAVHAARRGHRVGVVDTDIQSPGIHVIFGLAGDDVEVALNDHLFHGHPIDEVARDVTPPDIDGAIHLIPSSTRPGEITRVLRDGYDAQQLVTGFRRLVEVLDLDVLLIDTHPGLGEETLLSLVVSDTVLVLLRPDHQDYEGTGTVIEVAASLEVPRIGLVVNKLPAALDPDEVSQQVRAAYDRPVVGVLPHDDDLMLVASASILSLTRPEHPVALGFGKVTDFVLGGDR